MVGGQLKRWCGDRCRGLQCFQDKITRHCPRGKAVPSLRSVKIRTKEMRRAERSVFPYLVASVLLGRKAPLYPALVILELSDNEQFLAIRASTFVSNNVGEGTQHEAINACFNPLITLCEEMGG